MTTDPGSAEPEQSEWRRRAVTRGIESARNRAQVRLQGFLDAAFDLIDEKGTTDFTIQELIDRSQQSLRGFYRYFDGKDELLLALLEESVHESLADLRAAVDAETEPLVRLRTFVVRLYEWCDPDDAGRARGAHNRRPISEFAVQLARHHPDQVEATIAPIATELRNLLEAAADSGAIEVADVRRTSALVLRTVMYSWLGNQLTPRPRFRISAEDTWEFCLNGLRAPDHGIPS